MKDITRFLKDNKMKIIRSLGDGDGFTSVGGMMFPEQEDKFEAKIVEGDKKFAIKTVEIKTQESGFGYFLDGIERSKIISYHPTKFVPIIFCYIAAVVIKREDKKLSSSGISKSVAHLYLPQKVNNDAPDSYFLKEELIGYDEKTFKNIGEKDKKTGKYPTLPNEFTQQAHSAIQAERKNIEHEMSLIWLKQRDSEKWLFIDGRLEDHNDAVKEDRRTVGIIKSHHVRYFKDNEHMMIYTLKKGQRTSVFQPSRNNKAEEVYSWYLKLHDNNYLGNIDFGIIRVEIPAKEDMLKMVDEISSWILLETRPIAFPASRWDRMIYPIKYCEDYLKSKAPSYTQIEALA